MATERIESSGDEKFDIATPVDTKLLLAELFTSSNFVVDPLILKNIERVRNWEEGGIPVPNEEYVTHLQDGTKVPLTLNSEQQLLGDTHERAGTIHEAAAFYRQDPELTPQVREAIKSYGRYWLVIFGTRLYFSQEDNPPLVIGFFVDGKPWLRSFLPAPHPTLGAPNFGVLTAKRE